MNPSTGDLPTSQQPLSEVIRGVFDQYGFDAPAKFVFAFIGPERFRRSDKPKGYINVCRRRYGPSNLGRSRRTMNDAEKAALRNPQNPNVSLASIAARKKAIKAERAALDAEEKELAAVERILIRLEQKDSTKELDS